MTNRLDGKVVLITGAGSGLGREASQLFSSEGAKIAVVDIDGDRAEQTVKLVQENGGDALAITADVSKKDQITAAADQTAEHFGKLDVAWANAGVISRGGVPSVMGGEQVLFEDLTEQDWNDVLGVNLTGVIYTAQAAVPHLKANGGGTIIATSSAASFLAYHDISFYSATKAGVNGLVRGLALDLGPFGIRVNGIAPTHGMSPNFLMPAGSPVVGQSYEQIAGPWSPSTRPSRSSSTARRTSSTMPRSRSSWPRTTRRTCPARWSTRPTAAPRTCRNLVPRGPRPAQPQRLNPRGSPSPVSSAQQVRNTHDDYRTHACGCDRRSRFLRSDDRGTGRPVQRPGRRPRRHQPGGLFHRPWRHWIVLGYEEITQVLRDPATYSSYPNNLVTNEAFGKFIPIELDPPEHTAYRRALALLFTPKRMSELREMVRETVNELIDGFAKKGEAEFVAEFAHELPARVSWL